jgi:protein-S-isoprenylcysteine O-methyltransferase Ste14
MTPPESRPPTDYRRFRRETDRKLAIAVVLFLLVVGTGLIALIYRPSAGILAFICLLGGVGIIALLWILLTLIERWVGD